MSFFMALVMSGCIMANQFDVSEIGFLFSWRDAFFLAWPIAFPTAFIIQPIVQSLVRKLLPAPQT